MIGLNFVYIGLRVMAFEIPKSCRLRSFADTEADRFRVIVSAINTMSTDSTYVLPF